MNKKMYIWSKVLLTMCCTLCLLAGCKQNDEAGIQQKLIGALGLGSNKVSSNGKSLNPSEEDKEALLNSIQLCPEEAKITGKAYPRGNQQYCAYKDDKGTFVKHGEYRKWHANGKIEIKATYADGELEGEFEKYSETGGLLSKCTYSHGQENGQCTTFSNDGKKLSTTTYREGFKEGPYAKYDKDQNLQERGSYSIDLKNGLWEIYDKKGVIKEKGEYKDDIKHGKFINFNKDGGPASQGFYSHNQEIGHWIYFNKDGQRKTEGNYVDGKKHGRWVDYDSNGVEIRNTFYDYGRKLDSVKVNTNNTGNGAVKGFGKGDIFGGEPVKPRQNSYERPKKRDNRPAPLEKEGWSPM